MTLAAYYANREDLRVQDYPAAHQGKTILITGGPGPLAAI
jgi:hypothetical protein